MEVSLLTTRLLARHLPPIATTSHDVHVTFGVILSRLSHAEKQRNKLSMPQLNIYTKEK